MPATTPRTDRAHAAAMDAAWELFLGRGLRATTVEAVAAASGVAKTTIYRRWPSRNALVLDALHRHLDAGIGFPDTGSVRADLTTQVRAVIRLLGSDPGRAYLALIAESTHDPDLAAAVRDRYLAGRRAVATDVVRRGVERGELAAATDPEAVVDAIYGAVYYRFLVSHDPPSRTYAATIVRTVLGPEGDTT